MSHETDPLSGKSNSLQETVPPVATSTSYRSGSKRTPRCSKLTLVLFSILLILILLLAIAIIVLAVNYVHLLKADSQSKQIDEDPFADLPARLQLKPNRTKRNVRLPYTLVPTRYDLRLQVFLEEDKDFPYNGSVSIACKCRQATDFFHIHAVSTINVDFSSVSVIDRESQQPVGIQNISYDDELQWLTIKLDSQLQEDRWYTVEIGQFISSLNRNCKGWYLSHYMENGVKKYLATSQLQSTDARRVFPCWDEPDFKAVFRVTLIRDKAYHSLSNMELNHTVKISEDWYADVFEPTVNMSTYLLAFVVSQFKSLSRIDSMGRNFSVWAKPDAIHTASYALDIGTKILSFFEKYFKMDYPLKKIDMVAVPHFLAGAMENWGLMIYREETMLWDPDGGLAGNRQKVANVISHEIAHQWFGNLVTMRWWDDLWLNEGFSSFVEYIGVQHVHPEWDMDVQFLEEQSQKALTKDAFTSSRPMIQPVHYPNEINDIFDPISYSKGAAILRMIESFLGRNVFRTGVQMYLKENRFKTTVHNDLWRSLTQASEAAGTPVDVKTVMNTWMKQMNYPLVTVERVGRNRFSFRQSHYFEPRDVKLVDKRRFQWHIPLTIGGPNTTSLQEPEVIWFNNASMVVELDIPPGSWYIVNLGQDGFYRVHYADDNWAKLAAQLSRDHRAIPAASRTQILHDLCQLASQGVVSYREFLTLSTYLRKEDHVVPWDTARKCFSEINLMLVDKPIRHWFLAYIRDLVHPLVTSLDWTPKTENQDHMRLLLRSVIVDLACATDHVQCIAKAKEMYRQTVGTNSSSHIPVSIRETIYCTIAQTGGFKEWQFLNQLKETVREPIFGRHIGSELEHIRSSFSCFRDPFLLKQLVQEQVSLAEDEESDQNDIIYHVAQKPLGQRVLWREVRDYVSTSLSNTVNATNNLPWNITTYWHIIKMLGRRQSISSGLVGELELKDLTSRVKANKSIPFQLELLDLFRRINEQLKRIKQNLAVIEDWLKKHVSQPTYLLK